MSESKNIVGKRRVKRKFWMNHVESWDRSGLTQAQYCREHDLSQHMFGYHKSKLNKRDDFKPFLPVSVRPEKMKEENSFSSGVSLTFDARLNIQLEVGFSSDTLRRVIDLLGAG